MTTIISPSTFIGAFFSSLSTSIHHTDELVVLISIDEISDMPPLDMFLNERQDRSCKQNSSIDPRMCWYKQ